MTDFNFETYMLKQVDKINENFDLLRADVSDVKSAVSTVMTKIDQYNPEDLPVIRQQVVGLTQQVTGLELQHSHLEKRLREAEDQANILKGKWAILAILGGAVLSLSLSALGVALFKDSPDPPPPPPKEAVYQPAIPPRDNRHEGPGSYPPR